MMLLYDLSANGLFKIESIDMFVGGDIEWYKQYRLRHVISGKYISVNNSQKGPVVELTNEIN